MHFRDAVGGPPYPDNWILTYYSFLVIFSLLIVVIRVLPALRTRWLELDGVEIGLSGSISDYTGA